MASKVFLQWSRVQTAMFLGNHGKIVITLKMIEIKKCKESSFEEKSMQDIPIFRARFNFCSKKISSTEMSVTKVFNNIGTLGTLSTARAT